jgi:hypothetical protein
VRLPIALASLVALASGCLESPPGSGEGGSADGGSADASVFDCPGNLLGNPSFEDGTTGWDPVHATVALVAGGPLGSLAAEVCSNGTGEAVGYYSLDDTPQSVPDPKVGERYAVSAWVRAGTQAGPQTVDVVVREFDDAGNNMGSMTPMTPDDQWRRATAQMTVQYDPPASVDVYLASVVPAAGNCFQVDALCLQRLPEETVTP